MADNRPVFALGHLELPVADVGEALAFFVRHGLREVHRAETFAILELRGGTHIILSPAKSAIAEGQRAPFDLMTDDVDAAHARFEADGAVVSAIERGSIHDRFTVRGPSGYEIPVNSSHVVGEV